MQLPSNRFPLSITLVSLGLVILLGLADYLTGFEISFSVFYLGPIIAAAWFAGRGAGMVLAVASGGVWLAADLLAGGAYASPLIPYWNMGVRLVFFALTVFLVSEVKLKELRRRAYERIYFHDVLNTATAIRGFADLLRSGATPDTDEALEVIHLASEQIIEQIETQRSVSAAENHELPIDPCPVDARGLIENVVHLYSHYQPGQGTVLGIDDGAESVILVSDEGLVMRILGNMVKNALEATPHGGRVVAGCRRAERRVQFWVSNPGHIPAADQGRIFHPDFSSKGRGRGFGTYSMKLLAEYLGGKVWFVSNPTEGTVFTLELPESYPGRRHPGSF